MKYLINGVLPLMCADKASWNCVDFVPLKLFPRINIVLELPGRQIKNHAIMKRDLGRGGRGERNLVCLSCNYHNINQLKNPVCMNIIPFLNEVFYGMLPSMCADKASWICVDFVPLKLKLFPRINIVLELLRDSKLKITQYGCLWKGIWGDAIWFAIVVATIILISSKTLTKIKVIDLIIDLFNC